MDGPIETNTRLRGAVVIFPMFIATLSLATSIYNGYLNNKFVELIQQNVTRSEYIRTCKDIIDSYFLIKLKAAALSAAVERERAGRATDVIAYEAEADNAASHFGALGTYMANFQDDAARERYTILAWELVRIAKAARDTPPAAVDKLFEKADGMFTQMNNDCIKTAKSKI
jgi:dTDP-4-dehydrorhamnose reductase